MEDSPDERFDKNCRIGVLINDDCSLIDIANALAWACARASEATQCAKSGQPLSIQALSSRSGFVSRGNWSIPIWVEAIDDVAPNDFNVIFVARRPSSDEDAGLSKVLDWLARAGPEVQIISLAPEPATSLVERPAAKEAQSVVRRDTPPLSERIEASIRWLNEHYADHVSISEIAQRASMSERNFLRRFKAEVGRTPRQYLSLIRLENARQLLHGTDLPVDKIARHCGLFNGDHLRKQFLKHFGISPIEYRRQRVIAQVAPIDSNRFQ